jgi:hypothetical protein
MGIPGRVPDSRDSLGVLRHILSNRYLSFASIQRDCRQIPSLQSVVAGRLLRGPFQGQPTPAAEAVVRSVGVAVKLQCLSFMSFF